MTNIILCGCGGRMGKAITAAAQNDYDIVAGIDINASSLSAACSFPVYENIEDFPGKADVIVDFSHHFAVQRSHIMPDSLAVNRADLFQRVVDDVLDRR